MLKEFKEFAVRGNVLDLAIALVIGAAFGKIVTSFVNDVLMPPIGLMIGRMDFKDLFVNLSARAYPSLTQAKAAGAPVVVSRSARRDRFRFVSCRWCRRRRRPAWRRRLQRRRRRGIAGTR